MRTKQIEISAAAAEVLHGIFSELQEQLQNRMKKVENKWRRKPKKVCGIIGKDIASQNDLLVTEHEKAHAEANIAFYVKKLEEIKCIIDSIEWK